MGGPMNIPKQDLDQILEQERELRIHSWHLFTIYDDKKCRDCDTFLTWRNSGWMPPGNWVEKPRCLMCAWREFRTKET